jgi:putative sterol carrier protein
MAGGASGAEASGQRAMLAEAIRGKSDEEISQFVAGMGGEGFLDMTLEGMKNALNPEKAEDAVILYELRHGDTTLPYSLVIKDRVATVDKRSRNDAVVTLKMSVPDYLRLITDQLPIFSSVIRRRLRISGNRKFARRMQGMFVD